MAKERKGDMTVGEAGRKGGEVRKQELGHEGYQKLGHLGGEAVKKKYGPQFFEKIGKIGGEHSWTTGASGAKIPMVTEEDKQRAQQIRQRIDSGEDVNIDDVAFLGGLERVIQAHEGR